ncbi:CsgG/HfaB family protein [Verrucomicrobiota bacterium]
MRNGVIRMLGTLVLVIGMAMCNGCALLDTSTKTSDGDLKAELGEYNGLKHAIGCKDFANQSGWSGQWKVGNNLSIMLESALFDTGRFVMVEREKLRDVLMEQDLATSGRTAKAKKVAKTGLIRPARYIATGAVTEAEEGVSGGGAGVNLWGVRVGGSKSKAKLTIIAKLVDTTTGEVKAKKRIVGIAGRVGLNLGLRIGPVGGQIGGFKKTPLGEAAQDCINQAAIFFAKTMEEMPFEGSIVKVSRGKVIINRGSEFGMSMGQKLVMREEGELLTDPDTGAILGNEEGEEIGKLEVTKTLEKMSYCKILAGEKNPKPGTVVMEE